MTSKTIEIKNLTALWIALVLVCSIAGVCGLMISSIHVLADVQHTNRLTAAESRLKVLETRLTTCEKVQSGYNK